MKNTAFKITAIAALAIAATGCTRIETGEVGVRLNASKQIEGNELMPGSWNQTLIGSVIEFPVKDIVVALENKTPMTADNSALADFDITVVSIRLVLPSFIALRVEASMLRVEKVRC